MLRVFLVFEDMNQMNFIKTTLSKLGCVVETLGVELGLNERLLGFRPDVVLISGGGKKVNPLSVTQKVRALSSEVKVVLVLSGGAKISLNELAEQRYDAFIESPIEPLRLLTTLNQFQSGRNSIDLIEKYQKIISAQNALVAGQSPVLSRGLSLANVVPLPFKSRFVNTLSDADREKASAEVTQGIVVNKTSTISKGRAQEQVKELSPHWDRKRLDAIDEEKRRFVKELFRKK